MNLLIKFYSIDHRTGVHRHYYGQELCSVVIFLGAAFVRSQTSVGGLTNVASVSVTFAATATFLSRPHPC